MIYGGIDNGVTGTIGIITPEKTVFVKTPTIKQQSYTKKKANITRIEVNKLEEIVNYKDAFFLIERPMVNPKMFKTTVSAVRALEATLGVLERLSISYAYIDSKEWQRELLPKGVKGSEELKRASRDIGIRMFPEHKELIEKHGDADGMLIAEYCRLKYKR